MDWHPREHPTGEIQMHESANWSVLHSSINKDFYRILSNFEYFFFVIAECARSVCGVATKDAIAIVRDWFLNAKKNL